MPAGNSAAHLRRHVAELTASPHGLPVDLTAYDGNEYLARARVVENIVEADPDAYTLEEIREMMDGLDDTTAATGDQAP